MKKILSLLMIFTLVLTFVACGPSEKEENVVEASEVANEAVERAEEVSGLADTVYPLTLVDGKDREVVITSEPQTVISLAPSITETIYALGLEERLIGRTEFCNYPEAATGIASMGKISDPSVELIIAANPDLVIASTHYSEEVLTKLEEAEITVVVLIAQKSFEGAYEVIEKAGSIFNANNEAANVIVDMKYDVEGVLSAVEGAEKKSIYYDVGFGEWGDYTETGDTFIHEMLEMAGGSNIAHDGEKWKFNIETIVERDPEVVICSAKMDTKSTLEVTDKYMDLTAVKEARLLEVDPDIISRQGPRLAKGLKALAALLHPELFN